MTRPFAHHDETPIETKLLVAGPRPSRPAVCILHRINSSSGNATLRMKILQLLIRVLPLILLVTSIPSVAQDESFQNFDWLAAKSRAMATQRPRSFPAGEETSAVFAAALNGTRRVGFQTLLNRLGNQPDMDAAALIQSQFNAAQTDAQRAMLGIATKKVVMDASNAAQNAGFAALVTGDKRYQNTAMRALSGLARLSPRGETSVASEDLSAMVVARTLALGLDWFHGNWTAEDRAAIVQAISVRMEDFATKLVRGSRPFVKNPLVSHDNEVLGALAEVAVLMLGETPLAERWYDEFVPLYARLLTPFGGPDGGYANGTAYASWDVGEYSLRQWDTLRRAAGIDLTQKQWAKNFGRFLAYFLPPGTPVGVFGDAAELPMQETLSRYAKAYAYRVPSPLSRWYAAQWFREDPAALELLTAPVVASAPASYPSGIENAAHFPSVGWVAMHSSLQDRSRTSLYFKSSPYGAVSHSHSDQNSFVLNAAGRQLLIDSGYYDYFGSPHHYQWTKKTIAHNAITFDSGEGQELQGKPWGEVAANGQITQFSTSQEIDVAVGDATTAYSGKLRRATRGIAFLRPNYFVIFDSLTAEKPRTWEWNVHALHRFALGDDGVITATNVDTKVCIHHETSAPTVFRQSTGFPASPNRSRTEPRPDQWHGKFITVSAALTHWSVTILAMNCEPVRYTTQFSTTGAKIKINEQTFEFDGRYVKAN